MESRETVEILQDASVSVGPGYRQVIRAAGRWTRVGRTPGGHVFKPIDRVFTVEGAQIHEAYLVLDDRNRVVGLSSAFSPRPAAPKRPFP